MGRYSSDSDSSSDYYKKKKYAKSRNRSSSRSSSSSRYSSRSKKSKKSSRRYKRSRSPDRQSRHRRKSSERSSSRHTCRRSEKRSKRRSRSNSNRSSYSRNKDRSHSRERRMISPSVSKKKRSDSPLPKIKDRKSPTVDSTELFERLNKAASEAFSDQNKKLEGLFPGIQDNRSNVIDEINAPNFVQKPFSSSDYKEKDEVLIISEPSSFISFNNAQLKEEPGSLLHPNLLIEDQNDKLNRWIRKLYLIRQKTMNGESLFF